MVSLDYVPALTIIKTLGSPCNYVRAFVLFKDKSDIPIISIHSKRFLLISVLYSLVLRQGGLPRFNASNRPCSRNSARLAFRSCRHSSPDVKNFIRKSSHCWYPSSPPETVGSPIFSYVNSSRDDTELIR